MLKPIVFRLTALALALSAPSAGAASLLPTYEQGKLRVNLGGRIQGDSLLNSDLPDRRQEGGEIRRARLGLGLRYGQDWRARLSGDFSDGARLQELAVEYRGWPVWIEAGRILEPFGLADQSSSRSLAFLERPQATVLGGGYGFGAGASLRGERWALAASLVGHSGNPTLDGRDRALSARATGIALRNDQALWHLGASASLRKPEEGRMRYSALAETSLVSGLAAQSARLTDVDQVQLAGVETALRYGPVLVSAEAISASIDTASGSDPGYSGAYLEAAWAITGEQRPYSTRQGVFGALKPKQKFEWKRGRYGAIEVAARYGQIDLADAQRGGEKGQVVSLAANWTPIQSLRAQLKLSSIEEKDGPSKEDDTVVQLSVQFSF